MTVRQIAVVVEGQTEEAFISQVLSPRLGPDIHLQPIITHTRRTAGGAHKGGGGWAGYRRHLMNLVHQPHWYHVTTMIDFYAYPLDAPGHDCHTGPQHNQNLCVARRELAMKSDIPGQWSPFIMLHEFETLILAAGSSAPSVLGDSDAPAKLREIVESAGGPELVNDGPNSAPSKRVANVLPGYRKAQDAVAILANADLEAIGQACPHFGAWLELLST